MTTTDTATILLDQPGELIASVPALLGFHPVDSLVVLGRRGTRPQELRIVLRADLPPPHEARELVDQLLLPLVQHGATGVTMIVVGGQGRSPDDDLPHRELMARCDAALAEDGIPVDHQFWTPDTRAGVRWHCYDESDCTGRLPEPDSTELALAAAELGLSVHRSREDVTDLLQPEPPDILTRRSMTLNHRSRTAEPGTAPPPDALTTVLSAIEAAATEPPDLTDDDVIRLITALQDHDVRDSCLDHDTLPDVVAAERLWAALTRATPPPERAEPASLLSFSAYARGDGVLAGIALVIAEEADPGHRLCGLLRGALTVALPPEKIRQAGRRAANSARTRRAEKANPKPPHPEQPDPKKPHAEMPRPKQPDPKEPGPKEPGPKEPGPKEPAPEKPDPKEPTQEQAAPARPAPEKPAPEQADSKKPTAEMTYPKPPGPEKPDPKEPDAEKSRPKEPDPREPTPEQVNSERLAPEMACPRRLGAGTPDPEELGVARLTPGQVGSERLAPEMAYVKSSGSVTPNPNGPDAEQPAPEQVDSEKSDLEMAYPKPLGAGAPDPEGLGVPRPGLGRVGLERPDLEMAYPKPPSPRTPDPEGPRVARLALGQVDSERPAAEMAYPRPPGPGTPGPKGPDADKPAPAQVHSEKLAPEKTLATGKGGPIMTK
jgi:hypothetical protein